MDQPRKWRTLKRHPLSANYPDIKGHAWKRFVEVLTANGIANRRRIVIHERMVLDGWQLYRACLEADIRPEFGPLPRGWTAEEYVEMAQEMRRHESQEAMAAHAEERRARVAAARQEGQSIRQIAETEGVAAITVRRDIAETGAGGPGGTPDAKITGKDGKTYSASKPKPLCTRCQHCQDIGRPYDSGKCAACQDLRKPATDPMTSPKRGTGQAAKVAALIEPPVREPGDDSEEIAAEDNMPKSVRNALADTWHLECARKLAIMQTQVKGAIGWARWLSAMPLLQVLKQAQEYFQTAAPRRACPVCKGQKKIGKESCHICDGFGWLASQVLEGE